MNQTSYDSKSTRELFFELTRVYFIKKYKIASDVGMHPGQEALLNLVNNESGLNQKEIANKLKIQPPTVAVSIRRMEKAGWIKKEIDSTDKRVSRVFITKEGKMLLEKVKNVTKDIDQIIFSGVSDVEMCLLRRLLIQLIQNIRQTLDDKEIDEVMQEFTKHHDKMHRK